MTSSADESEISYNCDDSLSSMGESWSREKIASANEDEEVGDPTKRGVALEWKDINLNVMKKKNITKEILNGAWGRALPCETTAIMGASGSGKTSLFNALSGRIANRGNLQLNGTIHFGNVKMTDSNRSLIADKIAYVAQHDVLHETSTPREMIRFHAKLRRPIQTDNSAIDAVVSDILKKLRLENSADTIIGGLLVKGISGGEKKRTSIGVELVTDPSVIMLDEPTSGLDSFAATQLIVLLNEIASAGNTVLFTIHQPSSDTFMSFDRVLLLNSGKLMYSGKTKHIAEDFCNLGFPIKELTNPAEWLIDVAQIHSIEELHEAGFFPRNDQELADPNGEPPKMIPFAPFSLQFVNLMHREYISAKRLPAMLILSIVIALAVGFFSGVLFQGLGAKDRSDQTVLQGLIGAIVNALLNAMMGQATAALVAFSMERPLFLREYYSKTFSVPAYALSQWLVEVVKTLITLGVQSSLIFFFVDFQMSFFAFYGISILISMTATSMASLLGSSVKNQQLATAMFPLVILPQFYFSGVLVSLSLIPQWLRWVHWLCGLWYAMALTLIYELSSCSPEEQPACDATLVRQEVDSNKEWLYWFVFIGLIVVTKFGSIILTTANAKY